MSSRNQTQSLDRDLYRRKKKTNYPLNIENINNKAEHIACHYHRQIEDIFSRFSVNRFSEELSPEKLTDVIDDLSRKANLDNDELLKIKLLIKETFGDELLSQYLEFVIETKSLFQGINSLLSQKIRNGLIRYCISLADYCSSEIDFVINYEKIIQRNESDIIKEIDDIEGLCVVFRKHTSKVRSVLYHCSDIIGCIGKIRACINKLYYLITEWVDEERNYPSNLAENMKLIKSQIFTLQERIEKNRNSINIRQTKLSTFDKHIKTVKKTQIILRRKYRDIEYSKEQIDFKMKRLKDQETFSDGERLAINRKLEHLKGKENKTHGKVSAEFKLVLMEQRDFKTKQYRLDDSKLALYRHRERLYNASNDIVEKIDAAERDISKNKSVRNKLRCGLKEDTELQNNDLEKLNNLIPVLDDLNFLFSKKYSPETLRQLRNHGKLLIESKEINLMDKMCERVAERVADNWRELYFNLPFYPHRLKDQRYKDVEVIDLISAKNDNSITKQAKMSLDKWRLFYHNGTPEHLIEGLKKSNLKNITKEIEDLYTKARYRYEEE